MITDIHLRKLRNAEYLQFMNDVVSILRQYPDNALQSDAQIGTLSILVAELQILMHNDQASQYSNDVARLDSARDRLIIGLSKLCDAHTYGPDPDKRAAADMLCRSLEFYGQNIARQAYQAESAIITNILADWSSHPELTAAAARIGAEEWLTALQTANEGFKAMYLHRTGATAEGPSATIYEKRLETSAAWYKLRDRLDGFFTIHDGEAPWSTAIAHINALAAQYDGTVNVPAGKAVAEHMAGGNRPL